MNDHEKKGKIYRSPKAEITQFNRCVLLTSPEAYDNDVETKDWTLRLIDGSSFLD